VGRNLCFIDIARADGDAEAAKYKAALPVDKEYTISPLGCPQSDDWPRIPDTERWDGT
jgi:hypothetical protein